MEEQNENPIERLFGLIRKHEEREKKAIGYLEEDEVHLYNQCARLAKSLRRAADTLQNKRDLLWAKIKCRLGNPDYESMEIDEQTQQVVAIFKPKDNNGTFQSGNQG